MGSEDGGELDVLILDGREDGLGSDWVNDGGLVALLVDYLERKLFTNISKQLELENNKNEILHLHHNS
jgi:hypothetical protein